MIRSAITGATIRGSLGEGADGEHIDRLVTLTGSAPPRGALLVAEVDGETVAAVGIFDGRTVSDPARSTFALRARLHVLRLQLRVIAAVYGL